MASSLKTLLLLAGLTFVMSLSAFAETEASPTWQGFGVWTYDIDTARREAKAANRFFLYMLSGPSCASCNSAESAIFSRNEFKTWAIDNRIALVSAYAGNQNSKAFTEFRRLYPDLTAFPAIVVVDGITGEYMLGQFYAIALHEKFKEQLLLNPQGFIRMVDVILSKRDEQVEGGIGSNSYMLARATLLSASPEMKIAKLYNDYGQLALDKRSSTVTRYSNTKDWFGITNIVKQPGVAYKIQALDVVDESNYGRAYFFSTLADATARTNAFASMSLNELANGFTYTPTQAGTNYILIVREDDTMKTAVTVKYTLSYQQVTTANIVHQLPWFFRFRSYMQGKIGPAY